MKLPHKDQTLLEQAYTSIHEGNSAASNEYLKQTDQNPYKDGPEGTNVSTNKTVQPHMGKQDKLSNPQMQAALAILQQYAQGDISNVEAAGMFEDLYKKGVSQGPTQDDMHYTKN